MFLTKLNNCQCTVRTVTIFFGVLSVFFVSVSAGPQSVNRGVKGAKVIRVFTENSSDRQKFDSLQEQLHVEIIHETRAALDILVGSSAVEKVKKLLASSNLKYKVLIDDLERKIKAENPPLSYHARKLQDQRGYNLTFEHYHSLRDIYDYLDYLGKAYESFVSTEVIGTTCKGREIKVIKILSDYPQAPYFWIDGGTHAREWISVSTVLYIIRELVERRKTLPEPLRVLNFYIVPVINPDGYEYTRLNAGTRMWRKNRRPAPENATCEGVDINRNYDMMWGGNGTSPDPCEENYKGLAANSELETQAMVQFLSRRVWRVKGFVSFHSYSQMIMYSYAYGNVLPENHEELQRVGDLAARRIRATSGTNYTVGSVLSVMYAAAGGSVDWATAYGIPYSYCMELRDTGENGFILPASQIIPNGKEGFELIKTVAEALLTP